MNNHGWGNNPEPGEGDRKPSNNNQGPPDLEEVWRDFNRRLRTAFGGKSGGGSSNGGNRRPGMSPSQFGGAAGVVIALVITVWMCTGFYTMQEGERGIVLRLGKYHETTNAGLRWHWPYPIETVEKLNVSTVRTLEIGYRGNENNKVLKEALMLTDDENILSVLFAVQYQLKDPQQYLFSNRNQQETVTQAAETAIRAVVGRNKMDFVLNTGREEIATKTQELMQEILDRYQMGVAVRNVSIQSTQPPEQVKAAFDDATNAGQDKQRLINEGEAYANKVIPLAKGAASRLLEEANGYRQRMISVAEGDASRFKQVLTEYSKAPEVTRSRLYLETMQQVYSNTSKVMIDAKGQGNLLYLPLDKLMAAPALVAPPTTETAPVRAPSANANALDNNVPPQMEKSSPNDAGDPRKRETFRSRERGDR